MNAELWGSIVLVFSDYKEIVPIRLSTTTISGVSARPNTGEKFCNPPVVWSVRRHVSRCVSLLVRTAMSATRPQNNVK